MQMVDVQKIVLSVPNQYFMIHIGYKRSYPLLPREVIIDQALKAEQSGASSFVSFVLIAVRLTKTSMIFITIEEIKKTTKIDVNVSLGFITHERARRLKALGVKRYNHNLETSELLQTNM